jgi:glycosyltransferase involved in cell wall biosynthesis
MVPSGDRDSLANAMVHLLDDEGLRTRLGETGRARAAAYDWRCVTALVLAEYRNVLAPARGIGAT